MRRAKPAQMRNVPGSESHSCQPPASHAHRLNFRPPQGPVGGGVGSTRSEGKRRQAERHHPPPGTGGQGAVPSPGLCRLVPEGPASAPLAGGPNAHAGPGPGRPAVTDLGFRARTRRVGSPCPPLGPAPAGRTRGRGPGAGLRRKLTSPRRRAWAAAALRLAVVEAGAGSGERGARRRAAPPRDRAHRTAAAPPPPQLPRWPLGGAEPSSLPLPVRGLLGRPL